MEDNCPVDRYQKDVRSENLEKAQVAHLAVEGMGCPRRALLRVQNGLNCVDGVYEAAVSLHLRMAEVYYEPNQVQVESMVNAVAAAGDEKKHQYRAQIVQR